MANRQILESFGVGVLFGSVATVAAHIVLTNLPNIRRRKQELDGIRKQIIEMEHPKMNEVEDQHEIVFGIIFDPVIPREIFGIQCAHAVIAAYAKAFEEIPQTLKEWCEEGFSTRAVCLNSKEQMCQLENKATENNVQVLIIRDTYSDQVPPESRAVIAVGPAPTSVMDKIIEDFPVY